MLKQFNVVISSVLCCILLCTGCAERGTLSGGQRDTTAPYITSSAPVNGSTNVTGSELTIDFSDYIQKDVRNAITIQPRTQFTTSYAGNQISIEFAEPLRDTTTYAITLGTEWKTLNGNTPKQAYSVVFSTGPKIDTGKITGYVRANPTTGVSVLCYALPDTSTVAYSVPLGSSGVFEIPALRDGTYRVLAVRDANNNSVADPTEDLGTAHTDVVVTQTQPALLNILVLPALDTTSPVALRVRALFSTQVQVEFSEPVVTNGIAAQLLDSVGTSISSPVLFQIRPSTNTVVLDTKVPLRTGVYSLILSKNSVSDTSGNVNNLQKLSIPLRTVLPADTTKFRLLTLPSKDTTEVRDADAPFVLRFSLPADTSFLPAVSLSTNTGAVTTSTVWKSPNELSILPTDPLAQNSKYNLFINIDSMRSMAGDSLQDSSYSVQFRTHARRDVGSATGIVVDSLREHGPLIVQAISGTGVVVRTARVQADGAFTLDSLPPVDYTLDVIVDTDNNGAFTRGSVTPFRHAERWIPTATNLRIRPRWVVEGIRVVVREGYGSR